MDQQGPGDLAGLPPQRGQHVLAIPPGPDLVIPEPRTYPAPEPPRVAAVVPPGRQPGPQLVVVGRHGPVPQPLAQLARHVDDERLLASAHHPVHAALAGATVPDAGRAESRPDRQRSDDMP